MHTVIYLREHDTDPKPHRDMTIKLAPTKYKFRAALKHTCKITLPHRFQNRTTMLYVEKKKKKKSPSAEKQVIIVWTNLEDFKTSNIEDAYEGGSLSLSAVQSSVDPVDQPSEQTLVRGLRQGLNSKVSLEEERYCLIHPTGTLSAWLRMSKHLKSCLFFCLGLLHILSTHFDPGSEDGPSELQHIDAKQMAQFLGSCVVRHWGLVVVLLLQEGNVAKLEHSRDHLKHGWADVRQEQGKWIMARIKYAKNILLCLFSTIPSYLISPLEWSPLYPSSPWSEWSSLSRSDQERGWTLRWESGTHQQFLRAGPLMMGIKKYETDTFI